MKIKSEITSLVDQNGFGVNLIPVIYFGYGNYDYQKVYSFYVSWIIWEIHFELIVK